MRCVICNQADTLPGTTSVLMERDHLSLTVINVPVRICPNCSEAYADEIVAENLLHLSEEMKKAGAKVDVREYERAPSQ